MNTNSNTSKRLVQKAQDTGQMIALEDLDGIRDRVKIRRHQRNKRANWSFHHLRQCVEYEAQRAGVALVLDDPLNTSQACPVCVVVSIEPIELHNAFFACTSGGYFGPRGYRRDGKHFRQSCNQPTDGSLSYDTGTSCLL